MVASLLSLDISGAYDKVLPEVLKRILERKGIPDWFVTWTFSFTTQRYTTLCLITLNPPPSQFTVMFFKVLLSPLSYFFSIYLNSITLFTYLKKEYQPLVLQMIQTF